MSNEEDILKKYAVANKANLISDHLREVVQRLTFIADILEEFSEEVWSV